MKVWYCPSTRNADVVWYPPYPCTLSRWTFFYEKYVLLEVRRAFLTFVDWLESRLYVCEGDTWVVMVTLACLFQTNQILFIIVSFWSNRRSVEINFLSARLLNICTYIYFDWSLLQECMVVDKHFTWLGHVGTCMLNIENCGYIQRPSHKHFTPILLA